MVIMPENLREERDQLWQMLDEKHSPNEEVSSEQAYAEFKIILQKHGSPELKAWYKRRNAEIEKNQRLGIEIS